MTEQDIWHPALKEDKDHTHLADGSQLIIAMMAGNFSLAHLILKQCPNWYLRIRTRRGFSALHTACFVGNAQLTRMLITKIRVNQKAMYGETPLHVAAYYGYVDIVKILLEHGANPRVYLTSGKYAGLTPLNLTSSPEIKILLLERMERSKY